MESIEVAPGVFRTPEEIQQIEADAAREQLATLVVMNLLAGHFRVSVRYSADEYIIRIPITGMQVDAAGLKIELLGRPAEGWTVDP